MSNSDKIKRKSRQLRELISEKANYSTYSIAPKSDKKRVIINNWNSRVGVELFEKAAFKNPWFWVPVKHIYHAMHTKNEDGYRGYLITRDEFDDIFTL